MLTEVEHSQIRVLLGMLALWTTNSGGFSVQFQVSKQLLVL